MRLGVDKTSVYAIAAETYDVLRAAHRSTPQVSRVGQVVMIAFPTGRRVPNTDQGSQDKVRARRIYVEGAFCCVFLPFTPVDQEKKISILPSFSPIMLPKL